MFRSFHTSTVWPFNPWETDLKIWLLVKKNLNQPLLLCHLCSRLLYSIVVLSVQLLLPSAILILAHARSVQIAVHRHGAQCSVQQLLPSAILILAHARSVQNAVHHRGAECTATAPLCCPHTGSCQVSTDCCTLVMVLSIQLLLPSAILILAAVRSILYQYKLMYSYCPFKTISTVCWDTKRIHFMNSDTSTLLSYTTIYSSF